MEPKQTNVFHYSKQLWHYHTKMLDLLTQRSRIFCSVYTGGSELVSKAEGLLTSPTLVDSPQVTNRRNQSNTTPKSFKCHGNIQQILKNKRQPDRSCRQICLGVKKCLYCIQQPRLLTTAPLFMLFFSVKLAVVLLQFYIIYKSHLNEELIIES